MTKHQENSVRDRLVGAITDKETPLNQLPKLVNTLLNLEHCVHEIKLNPVKKEQTGVGFHRD